jgi:hypothetical protein
MLNTQFGLVYYNHVFCGEENSLVGGNLTNNLRNNQISSQYQY